MSTEASVKLALEIWTDGVVTIRNDRGQRWCGGRHGWVAEDSSYYQTTPDCYPEAFPWIEDAFEAADNLGATPDSYFIGRRKA